MKPSADIFLRFYYLDFSLLWNTNLNTEVRIEETF